MLGALILISFFSVFLLVSHESHLVLFHLKFTLFPLLDVWSAGCVFAELLLGQPIFPGESGVDQLVEIIKVLGTPSHEQIRDMNPEYREFKFPQIKAHPWPKVGILVTTKIISFMPIMVACVLQKLLSIILTMSMLCLPDCENE